MHARVNIAAEDRLSEAVLKVLLSNAKGKPVVAHSYPVAKGWQKEVGPNGYGYIKKNLTAFNAASVHTPFVALIDADNRPCPPETIGLWLEGVQQNPTMIIRVAIREVEAWLLADRKGIASYLAVSEECIPIETSRIKDPKRYISRLAARSRRKEIRAELARAPGTRSKTGPVFAQALQFFVNNLWDFQAARAHSNSLDRAMAALDKL
ncbi:MAG: hypothetical protein K9N47_27600 [Prosthecobacter sp.]|uniref:hypothetical protein n=1 Tax=Prosthecobacter sp. TaxID=1965333 RepID=UPI00260C7CF1|nr:hypothetical protein [Prosthecobacter sp.]MCF7789919.1 hypothetical protein [Prosthecobacter sp.]